MATSKKISQEIKELDLLKSLTRIYGEVASLKMKKTRDEVVQSRIFLKEVNGVFQVVILSYKKEVERLYRKNKNKETGKITLLSHNGKQVSTLLSSNTGLYGAVIQKDFRLFSNKVKDNSDEITIIGKTGRRMFEAYFPSRPYTYFELEDGNINSDKTSEIVRHLVQYEKINIYYGQFRNVISQEPTVFGISAESYLTSTPNEQKQKAQYIFEPDLKTILQFFETEIFASLFDQTMREHELAKFGSRVLAMDTAQANIDKTKQSLSTKMLRAKHRSRNRKQLNAFSSSSLWK